MSDADLHAARSAGGREPQVDHAPSSHSSLIIPPWTTYSATYPLFLLKMQHIARDSNSGDGLLSDDSGDFVM